MPESWRTRLFRWGFYLYPCYLGTGGRVTYLAADWREARVALPLAWRTRNYVGPLYGGSIYGAVDPIYMLMLIKVLGPGYLVWDKAAAIRFKKPGRSTLFATFVLDDAELAAIHAGLAAAPSVVRHYTIALVDAEGVLHAEVDKEIYIRQKDAPSPATPGAPPA